MTTEPNSLRARAADLRDAFDRSFADARSSEVASLEALLDITCAGVPYALRVADIAGLMADRHITPVASAVPELIGIAGVRGAILPVYDLGALLGHPAGPKPRWIAIAAGDVALGLAFARFDGQLHVGADAIVAQDHSGPAAGHVRHIVHLEAGARPVISVASILDAIANRARAIRNKE